MQPAQRFSLRARGVSFKYAIQGVVAFFKTEHNALIHLFSTITVIVFAVLLSVTFTEAVLLTIVTGLVWVAELFNTAIEKIMDYISEERKPAIKYIKDVAAAAVLVSALTALITGCLIFIPKL